MKAKLSVKLSNPSININATNERTLKLNVNSLNGSGTMDYTKMDNKPQIESVELVGNNSFADLGLEKITNTDLFNILK